jgi:filamentous hemagglutinin family protein
VVRILTRLLAAATAATAARADVVVGPVGAGPNAVVQANGPLTTVSLSGPARIEWQDFTLTAGRELRFSSQNQGAFPSLNIVRNPAPAIVDGRITADGPFYLISPGGVQIGNTGRIEAPRVLLSTLMPVDESRILADGSGNFAPNALGGAIGVDGVIETTGGPLVVLSGTVSTGNRARLRAPGGEIRIAAVDSAPVGIPPAGVPLSTPSTRGSGLVNSTGWIEARRVEIVSDGFVVNGGRISSLGQGNQVRLAAPDIVHESRPDNSSVIMTSALSVEGAFRQVGAVINPSDGANPAVAAGLRQTPRLSSGGFIATVEPGQTQLSHAPLQAPQTTASAVPPPLKRSSSLAVRRRGGAVKKASFFGQKVRH